MPLCQHRAVCKWAPAGAELLEKYVSRSWASSVPRDKSRGLDGVCMMPFVCVGFINGPSSPPGCSQLLREQ